MRDRNAEEDTDFTTREGKGAGRERKRTERGERSREQTMNFLLLRVAAAEGNQSILKFVKKDWNGSASSAAPSGEKKDNNTSTKAEPEIQYKTGKTRGIQREREATQAIGREKRHTKKREERA